MGSIVTSIGGWFFKISCTTSGGFGTEDPNVQDLRFRMPGPVWCGVFCCPKNHMGSLSSLVGLEIPKLNPLQKKVNSFQEGPS